MKKNKVVLDEALFKETFTECTCPVCGNKTFDNHWICEVCFWENDNVAKNDKDYSAENQSTVEQYRAKYKAAQTK